MTTSTLPTANSITNTTISPISHSSLCSSPFLAPSSTARANSLAILHLKRYLLIPTILRSHDDANDGYSEGKVTNTRFGSFPHSTLIGVPWGSQVRASAVDTGSRGRIADVVAKEKKRKRGNDSGIQERDGNAAETMVAEQRDGNDETEVVEQSDCDERPNIPQKAAVAASTGFVHLLPPTPETWTSSLPHRTQVVYTPDYSYILHRLRARPGNVIIEAGAGSGSFTHAAARAVFNGYSDNNPYRKQRGKVWSYEFHEQRMQKLRQEISEHGLDGIVEITHKDVCQDGFTVENGTISLDINANAVFLDLPAPWMALKHLTRKSIYETTASKPIDNGNNPQTGSILDPHSSVYLCTFSPCIEQVQRTIFALRKMGWLDIETVELSCKRLETKRERVGLQEEGLRGVNSYPATVDEAMTRLRDFESRSRIFHNEDEGSPSASGTAQVSKQQRLSSIRDALEGRKLYKEGRLVHRAEQELKMHTSYLVFAILPREWSLEDELRAQEKWPGKAAGSASREGAPMSKRQMKRAAKAKAGGNKVVEMEREKGQKDEAQDP